MQNHIIDAHTQISRLAIAWKKDAPLSPANRAFVDFLIQEVDDYYALAQAAATFPLP
ncbi:hypothetical protein GPEL0_01r4267 [Geoanaerobacter pelophilus]|uniref:Uncharacterized protein n=1 Tax=Geoanaerobacter pelophilus TaxID=60036 RepID=A0ABQ0MLZ2_9BACT|nr:hypothetical protein [Geoanaerobacter pelophilus]GAW68091.1 hypothetical protein GPEL0_01r4267 [Geoanaerobacter pelophilus]